MKVIDANINGIKIIEPRIFNDDRGFFFESFNAGRYKEAGINGDFVQDNISGSQKGTLRGLHYQAGEFAQGKLCQVIYGKVFDVAVDIRFGSPTFGKYFGVELSDENKKQIWIPPGFAHGFAALSEFAIFSYKCTAIYNKESERTILYSDPEIGIDWGIENPILSPKDLEGKGLNEIEKDFLII